jgi:hypothetical protein
MSHCLNFVKVNSLRSSFLILFIFILALASILFAHPALSAEVSIAWNPVATQVASYKVYYGPSTRNYTSSMDVGNETAATLQDLSTSTYYIAITYYTDSGAQSGFSPELVIYPLTSSAGAGGTISPSGTFFQAQGASQTFTITPSAGYTTASVQVDGKSAGAVGSYTLTGISAPHTITATFAASFADYNITATAGSNGSISPSGSITVPSGGSLTFAISPNAGYSVGSVVVDGKDAGAVTSYTFSGVKTDHTISAIFAQNVYTIIASAGAGGSISPSGAQSVKYGASQSYTITPSIGHSVSTVLVDGKNMGPVTSYNFSSVTAPHTISATFIQDTYTIASSAGIGGSISPSGTQILNYGTSKMFAITPAGGHRIADVTADGVSVGAVTKYTFSDVSSNHTIAASFMTGGQASQPIADAGPDQTVATGTVVTLDGSNSTDAGGLGIKSFQWTQLGGTPVTLSNAGAVQTTFTAPSVQGALLFQLTTTDIDGKKSISTCIVNAVLNDMPPGANAGIDQTVSSFCSYLLIVKLNGSKSADPSGHVLSYHWQQIDGPAVTLYNAKSPEPCFIAPQTGAGTVSLSFRLTVTNKFGLKSTDICFVNVTGRGSPPHAVVAPSEQAGAGSIVQLDGSGSTPSTGIASFRWHQQSGAPVILSDPMSATPTFMAIDGGPYGNAPAFRLIVKNKSGMRSRATEVVSVH